MKSCLPIWFLFLAWVAQGTRYGNKYEGDIAVRGGQSIPTGNILSGFVTDKKLRWNKVIQYSIGQDLSDYREIIVKCLQWITDRSCLRFQEGTTGDHIKFTSFGDKDNAGAGCWSYFGRQGGQQAVNLEIPGCVSKSTIVHEIFHALGKVHEQSRPDRANHVEILWDNIEKNQQHNFKIQENVDVAGTAYDILSIMHYEPKAFSKTGKPTIIAKSGDDQFGYTEVPTDTDVLELNVAYQCDTNTEGEAKTEYPETETEYPETEYPETETEYPETESEYPETDTDYPTYEEYENVYADYENLTSIIDLINSQY